MAAGVGVGAAGLEPKDLAQLMDFAQLMAKAGPMVGKAFRGQPGSCLAITMQAMRWGMDPFAVSQKAYVANESIAYEAQLVNAVILSRAPLKGRPDYEFEGEGDQRRCKVLAVLKNDSMPKAYLSPPLAQIKAKSPLWKDDPDQQLAYYSIRAWARRHCPEIIMGVYTVEEVRAYDGEFQRIPDNVPSDDESYNQAQQSDERPFLAGRGFAAMREEKMSELHVRMQEAQTEEELDEALKWFTEQWRVSKLNWGAIQEWKAEELERIEAAEANASMDDAFKQTLAE